MRKILKEMHEKTAIPEDLDIKVDQAIYMGTHTQKRFPYKSLTSVAACFIAFVVLLNTSSAFAESMMDIPILKHICNIFTFREYTFEDENKIVSVKIPKLSETGNSDLETRVNYKISKIIQDEVKASEDRALEYYNAFLATGGKKEDFLPVNIIVDYEIKNLNEKYVSFIINKFENLASAYNEYYYYNIDLDSGREMSLKDIVGSEYKNIIYKQIMEQIETMDPDRSFYLFGDISIIDLIDENRVFYINKNGNIVIVFEKYEIGAGAAGKYEFELNINMN